MTCAKSRNSCVYARLKSICAEYGLETWLAKRDEKVSYCLTCSSSVNNTALEH